MRFLTIVKSADTGRIPPQGMMDAIASLAEEAGSMLVETGGLLPTSAGRRYKIRNRELVIVDGPFAETKEVLAGFNLIEAGSMEEAVRIAQQLPWTQYGCIEVRPVGDMQLMRQRVGA